MEENIKKNYFYLIKRSVPALFYNYVVFLDVENNLAEDIFEKYGIKPKYYGDWYKDGNEYVITLCRIPKWHNKLLPKIFDELTNKILVCGHKSYLRFCDSFYEKLMLFLAGGDIGEGIFENE